MKTVPLPTTPEEAIDLLPDSKYSKFANLARSVTNQLASLARMVGWNDVDLEDLFYMMLCGWTCGEEAANKLKAEIKGGSVPNLPKVMASGSKTVN
jgi:hypothetical protein